MTGTFCDSSYNCVGLYTCNEYYMYEYYMTHHMEASYGWTSDSSLENKHVGKMMISEMSRRIAILDQFKV